MARLQRIGADEFEEFGEIVARDYVYPSHNKNYRAKGLAKGSIVEFGRERIKLPW